MTFYDVTNLSLDIETMKLEKHDTDAKLKCLGNTPMPFDEDDLVYTRSPTSMVILIQKEKPKRKRGFMRKRGEAFKNWKKRFFILEMGVLKYKVDEHETTPPIKTDRVESIITWNGRDHGLCVKLASGRDLYLHTETETKHEAWYGALESHIKYNQTIKVHHQIDQDEEEDENI